MFIYKVCILLLSLLFIPSFSVEAIMIDKMLHISDNKNDYYKITNNLDFHLFINTNITEKIMENGVTVSNIDYTADNVDDWGIYITPSKFILAPNETKIVYVNRNACSKDERCESLADKVFSIAFIPQVYDTGKEREGENVGILFGYAPSFIVLAEKRQIKYKLNVISDENENYLELTNDGNSLLKVVVEQCKGKAKSLDCMIHKTVLANRKDKITLLDKYRKGDVKVTISDGDESYRNVYYK